MSDSTRPHSAVRLTPSAHVARYFHGANLTPAWQSALASAIEENPVETAASYGRWWHDTSTGHWIVSSGAADLLHVTSGWHQSIESCFEQVLPDDISQINALFKNNPEKINVDFRFINEISGLRWLRLQTLDLPAPTGSSASRVILSGILLDITATKHAEIREKLSFESTQHLVGTETLHDAVTNVIQLVCENLGWDWGAYWSLAPESGLTPAASDDALALVCTCLWQADHSEQSSLNAFTKESCAIKMLAGQGLIGKVWQTGESRWIEDVTTDPAYLRSKGAKTSRLKSGYMFPVFYVGDDGHRHSPGVLEFYSRLSRQSEAQLPKLAVTIGTLIAQTALRHERQETMRRLAQIDELTTLANRRHFYRMLDLACEQASTDKNSFGLMFIDLDRFKPVNDAYGHEAGNVVLREFAQRLQSLASTECHIGRLGGDEFAILLTSTDHSIALTSQLDTMAEQVLMAARRPFLFENHEMTVSASIGISVFP